MQLLTCKLTTIVPIAAQNVVIATINFARCLQSITFNNLLAYRRFSTYPITSPGTTAYLHALYTVRVLAGVRWIETKLKKTKTKVIRHMAESLWQVHSTPRSYSPGGSIGLTVWLQLAIACLVGSLTPKSLISLRGQGPLPDSHLTQYVIRPHRVHSPQVLCLPNGMQIRQTVLSTVHECDKGQTTLWRNGQKYAESLALQEAMPANERL